MTLHVVKGQENRLVLTLSELADVDLPNNWLFVFTKDQGGEQYKLFLTDVSPFEEVYNQFALTEGSDVTFADNGDYKYEVYQMPDTDDLNQTRGQLVEVGKLRVVPASIERPAYTPNKNKHVYRRSTEE
jgi:hypothetical protein